VWKNQRIFQVTVDPSVGGSTVSALVTACVVLEGYFHGLVDGPASLFQHYTGLFSNQ